MATFDKELDYNELIRFTDGSLQLASFVQIRNALIKRFKDIYGNDIDIDAASADGQYVNSIALLINNIFQTVKKSYDSLDPAAATGQFLDTLCSYNNITRITPTYSTVQLYIYNSGENPETISQLTFIDRNNILWNWNNGGKTIIIPAKSYYLLSDVECSELGNISAPGTNTFKKAIGSGDSKTFIDVNSPAQQSWDDPEIYEIYGGSIFQTLANSGLWVWQYSDAIPGHIMESDEALRSRRYQMLGNTAVTVLEGLKGSLLKIDSIKDVYIFNNSTNTSITLSPGSRDPIADGTQVGPHSIYIALRYEEGVVIDLEKIGTLIYQKLTPGISTTAYIDVEGIPGKNQSYEIIRTSNISNIINWKKCESVKPQITINFQINPKIYDVPIDESALNPDTPLFASHIPTSDIEKRIVSKLQQYINEIKISDYMNFSNLSMIMQQSDIQREGMNTFFVLNGDILKDDEVNHTYNYPANLRYFKYDDSDYKFSYGESSGSLTGTGTLIIG